MMICWGVGVKHHLTIVSLPDGQDLDRVYEYFLALAHEVKAPVIKTIDKVSYWPSSDVTVAEVNCPCLLELGKVARQLADSMGIVYHNNHPYSPHITVAQGYMVKEKSPYLPGDHILLDKIYLQASGELIDALYFHTHAYDVIHAMAEAPPKFMQELAQRALELRKSLPKGKQASLPLGLKRKAKEIATGKTLSMKQLKAIEAFLKKTLKQVPTGQIDPSTSTTLQSLMLLGSNNDGRALKWVQKEISRRKREQLSVMAESVKPPKFVQEIAERALEIREDLPKSKKCCKPTGLARANQLAKGENLSLETLKRMKSFISRMKANVKSKDPEESKAYQSLMIWGSKGDGRTLDWVERQINKLEANSEAYQDENLLSTIDDLLGTTTAIATVLGLLARTNIGGSVPRTPPQKVDVPKTEPKGEHVREPEKPKKPEFEQLGLDLSGPESAPTGLGDGSRDCNKGKACGGGCIAKSKECVTQGTLFKDTKPEVFSTNAQLRVSDPVVNSSN